MRTNNPLLKSSIFAHVHEQHATELMTLQGTVQKSIILLMLLCGSSMGMWWLYYGLQATALVGSLMLGAVITGFITCYATLFKPTWAPFTALIYAISQGLAMGGFTAYISVLYAGLPFAALGITLGILAGFLLIYRYEIIQVTADIRSGILAATLGVGVAYLFCTLLRLFSISVPFIHQAGPLGIIFSLLVVGVAAFNLLLDFDFIDTAIEHELPKYFEWYAALSLMVTLIWIYSQVINLLVKIMSRK